MIQNEHQNQHNNVLQSTKWSFCHDRPSSLTWWVERTTEKQHQHELVNLKNLERFCVEELSLISCQVFSKLIRHYRRKRFCSFFLNEQSKVWQYRFIFTAIFDHICQGGVPLILTTTVYNKNLTDPKLLTIKSFDHFNSYRKQKQAGWHNKVKVIGSNGYLWQ